MVEPAGQFSEVLEHLRESLSQSATLRTLLGAVDATAAKARIHYHRLPEPAAGDTYTETEQADYRPFVLVGMAINAGFRVLQVAAYEHTVRGTVSASIVAVPDDANGRQAADVTFANQLGAIMSELADLSGTAGCLAWREARLAEGPLRLEWKNVEGHAAEELGARIDFDYGTAR